MGPVTTLSDLYNKLLATYPKETGAINDLFVMNDVSPAIVTPSDGERAQGGVAVWHKTGSLSFQFDIPQGSRAMDPDPANPTAGKRNLLNIFG